jgi:hypothetical protein
MLQLQLLIRNYSQATAHTYVEAIRRYAEYFHLAPDKLGREQIRRYQLHLIEESKLEPRSVMVQMAALRFLYRKVLREICSVSLRRLRRSRGSLTAEQKSAEGVLGPDVGKVSEALRKPKGGAMDRPSRERWPKARTRRRGH